jgi:hypothetical protein
VYCPGGQLAQVVVPYFPAGQLGAVGAGIGGGTGDTGGGTGGSTGVGIGAGTGGFGGP